MIVLTHNILPPYRIPLFNAIAEQAPDGFEVILQRDTHPKRRKWEVDWSKTAFQHSMLRGVSLDYPRLGIGHDLSWGLSHRLNSLKPSTIVVNGWDNNVSWAAIAWARRRRVPVIGWSESGGETGRYRGRLTSAYRSAFLRACQGVIVPGAAAAKYTRKLGFHGPIFHMANAVERLDLRRLSAPSEAQDLLFAAELSSRKGLDIILDAIPELLSVASGILIGGHGPMEPAVKALAAKEPRVRYLGYLTVAMHTEAVRRSSVFLAPSRSDPWPLAPVEALVGGRPLVIGRGVGSAPELLGLEPTAVAQMRNDTPAELIRCLHQVMRQTVGIAARSAFTPKSEAQKFVAAACSGNNTAYRTP